MDIRLGNDILVSFQSPIVFYSSPSSDSYYATLYIGTSLPLKLRLLAMGCGIILRKNPKNCYFCRFEGWVRREALEHYFFLLGQRDEFVEIVTEQDDGYYAAYDDDDDDDEDYHFEDEY